MNKKKIFAIVAFVILGLFMFTFANSINDNDDNNTNQTANSKATKENSDTDANNQENTQEEAPRVAQRANNANQAAARQVQQPAQQPAQQPVEQPAEEVKPAEKVEEQKPAEEKPAEEKQPVEEEKPAEEVIKEEGNDKIDLTLDKLNAIKELKDYKKGYPFDNKEGYNKVIEDYSNKINESETLDDIKSNLTDGKKAIDKLIAEDLAAYKKAAKKEIIAYLRKLNLSTDVTKLIFKSMMDINNAKYKFQVKWIVKNTKKALDGVYAKELADAKRKAKEEIKKYRAHDEKYISKVTDAKKDIYKNIDKAFRRTEVANVVNRGKKAIDAIIANTKFTVKFYDFYGNKISTQTVGYKKDAKAPWIFKTIKKYNDTVVYEFDKWNADFTNVKADVKVYAQYKITKLYADVYANDDKIMNNVELVATKELKDIVNAYKGHNITLEINVKEIVKAKLPKIYDNNKYKTISYNAIKFTSKGFKVLGTVYYDELGEAKDTLKELIKKAEKVDTEGKTKASIKALNDNIDTAKEVVKGNNIEDIKKSIEALSNFKLVDIKVTEVKVKDNKNGYYVQGQDLDLTVTYSNNNGVEDKETSKYTIHKITPTRAYVTVDGVKSEEFEFTVVAKVVEKITKVVNNKDLYYKNDKLDITVTAKFNDGEERTLKADEYTTNFTTYKSGTNIDGLVKATSNENATKGFKYNVSKYNSKADEDKAKAEAEEAERKELIKKLKIEVKNKGGIIPKYRMTFKNINDRIKVKSVVRDGFIHDHTVTLNSTDTAGEYKLSWDDYAILRLVNSDTFGQYIIIKYTVDGKNYTAKYREENKGNLIFVSVE